MAYNILKGNVEGSVDQHADQEIGGVKVFKNTISASVFYDTDAQSPCATMKDVAIKKIKGNTQNGILICEPEHGAKTSYELTYTNQTLKTKKIEAEEFKGSALNLTNVPADKFTDQITANFIKLNYGLENVRGSLQVRTFDGLRCDEDGVSLNIAPSSGLSLKGNRLTIDPNSVDPVNANGQNLSDLDLLVVADISRNTINSTTLTNLYSNYINSKVPHAEGNRGEIQFKGKKEFEASSRLNFDSNTNTLNVVGKVNSNSVVSKDRLICEGAVYHNITKITNKEYNVNESDYTILGDASNNKINIILPPAQNNVGRIIIVKKTNSDKYKLNSNSIVVTCEEGTIDFGSQCDIKMNYSSRTFQSDGENWWIVGTKGS